MNVKTLISKAAFREFFTLLRVMDSEQIYVILVQILVRWDDEICIYHFCKKANLYIFFSKFDSLLKL